MGRKEIWLVRHAEGEHNVKDRKVKFSFDPPLTNEGWRQAWEMHERLKGDGGVDLICVSPLRRTLQTADALFRNERCEKVAIEDLRERTMSSCNWRRSVDEQEQDFPDVDYSAIERGQDPRLHRRDETPESVYRRSLRFLQWLSRQPESRVAIVTHWQVLYHGLMPLMCPSSGDKQRRFKNCEVRCFVWEYEVDRAHR
eukprot:TRINITY_DN34034_c0_g1_i1.p1 TRINITY_DN34034_c0_g1~~TRINITY_DN34034_c0_g1_i1.p1  ORF type:complete len:198 (+),score=26.42 TRINITY_DN34034_c0_g1_i1:37-630(+)